MKHHDYYHLQWKIQWNLANFEKTIGTGNLSFEFWVFIQIIVLLNSENIGEKQQNGNICASLFAHEKSGDQLTKKDPLPSFPEKIM